MAVGGRVFELREEVWTDVTLMEDTRVFAVRAYSQAWFDLIDAIPELGSIMREHDSIVIAGQELSVRVGDEGSEELSATELAEVVTGFRGTTGA